MRPDRNIEPIPEAPKIPEHREKHPFQSPVEAVKIFLDRAIAVMRENDGIYGEDWAWFEHYTRLMYEHAGNWKVEKETRNGTRTE